ncbi:Fe-S cluster assembly iron-binding protein IscA [Seinonella peptonophila]|uniref:Fe-S cluster assembly iron-binding protein IscA n=1 Tax=Seinonella peptonophila TaxID=112248 RepID=A0A1M5AJI5_9BACL|nr:hypothetical protein [Seinonella peptonophila]SHF30438.1 Fe-S cluster assembly iron-binding protein IscA [Seinonella peptonophila]
MKPTSKQNLHVDISDLAAAKLKWLLTQEQDQSSDWLGFRVIPLTSGCNTPSFAIEMTEWKISDSKIEVKGVPFLYDVATSNWLDGLVIDVNRDTGRFSVYHPNPPEMGGCPLPS